MKELAFRLGPEAEVRLVSISVDPEHDRPDVLAAYAGKWQVPKRPEWLFLTGEKGAVRELVRTGFLLPVEDAPENVAMPILHSNRFVLVDARGRIRGYYDAFEPDALDRLAADLDALRGGA
jgi:protein SCO1/2